MHTFGRKGSFLKAMSTGGVSHSYGSRSV
jgi:hypothetical protein